MNRGVRGSRLYTDDHEHEQFLGLLAETCRRYVWLVSTYCLLDNHYHLLVTTIEPTLSRGMQWLNGCYAQWFNWRHGHLGHAFFRRFHSVTIETEEQLAQTARYIVLNPVRAGLCSTPADWRWSSYRAMVGSEPPPRFLSCDSLLAQFGVDRAQARANFSSFVMGASCARLSNGATPRPPG
jgi:REP element-mobilizing transposase RayT